MIIPGQATSRIVVHHRLIVERLALRCLTILLIGKHLNHLPQLLGALEVQNEIAEYRLRLNRKQGEWTEANIPEEGGKSPLPAENSRLSQPTLADVLL